MQRPYSWPMYAGLWSSGDLQRLSFAQGHTKCVVCFPVQAWPDKKARKHLFSLSTFACIRTKWSNQNTDESVRIKDEITSSKRYRVLEDVGYYQLLPWQSSIKASERDLCVILKCNFPKSFSLKKKDWNGS